jgi:glycogen synthase
MLVGEDTLKNENGRTFKEEFLAQHNQLLEQEQVVFAGRVSDEELLQHYANCDIFVSPSVFESFGLIFIEAMMFGKPVIGCRAGGMVEIIRDGENGFLAEPGDWISLFDALLKLIESKELRERFGRCSREIFTAQFTRQRMADDTLAYCYQVLNQQPISRAELTKLSS